MTLNAVQILWLISFGVAAAVVFSYINKLMLGKFVLALLKIDAVGQENAISFEKLGVKPNSLVKQAIRSKGFFSEIVKTADGGQTYYIEPSMKSKANGMYGDDNVRFVFVLGLLLIMLCVLLVAGFLFGDVITDLFNSAFGS